VWNGTKNLFIIGCGEEEGYAYLGSQQLEALVKYSTYHTKKSEEAAVRYKQAEQLTV